MINIEKEIWRKNKILRTLSKKIKKFEMNKYVKVWKEMIKYIKNPKNWWIWLSAPQIWINVRLIVVSLPKSRNDKNYDTVIMINPEILEYSSEKEIWEEWCLSIPWKRWDVERSKYIRLIYENEKWNLINATFNDLQARIVQHEIDHLNWILFIDRLISNKFVK